MPGTRWVCGGLPRRTDRHPVRCRLCGSDPIPFWTVHSVPTSSCVLHRTREDAAAQPIGDIALEVCPTCGFIQNTAFDPDAVDYLAPYEESQAHSPTFQRFAEDTIDTLLDRYDLRGKTVLEVGCGKAEWLALICKKGDMRGVGIDAAYVPGRVPAQDEARFEVIRQFFGPDSGLTGDLVACRHTLEHVPNVAEFATWLAEATHETPGSTMFVEVPDTDRILAEGAFWDVFYEHCSYFTTTSLGNLAAAVGLEVHDLRLDYADQYLLLEARPGQRRESLTNPETIVSAALAFGDRASAAIEQWHKRLADAGTVVLWGATSKTVSFVGATEAKPEAVVDINPAKQGTFLPGSGLPIIAPEHLSGLHPDLVIAMNPIYLEEIRRDLARLDVASELVGLGPG